MKALMNIVRKASTVLAAVAMVVATTYYGSTECLPLLVCTAC